MFHRRHATRARTAGFTLVEALIATVILTVGTMGIAQLLGASSQQAEAMQSSAVSYELARQLMEEIASHPVTDFSGNISLGREAGENLRSDFDQIDDYDRYTDTSASLTMMDGTAINLGSGPLYTRSVAVEYRLSPSGTSTNDSSAPFCVVTVTVSAPGEPPATLVRLFARTSGGT